MYILKHPSRYDAWKNWVAFNNDREWEQVLDQPVFQGLLIGKPESVFMTLNDYSERIRNKVQSPGGVFELRTYTASAGKLVSLNSRFQNQTARLFVRHGMKNVAYWTPFDVPDSSNQLIYLLHHSDRRQADASWNAFVSDPGMAKGFERLTARRQTARRASPASVPASIGVLSASVAWLTIECVSEFRHFIAPHALTHCAWRTGCVENILSGLSTIQSTDMFGFMYTTSRSAVAPNYFSA